MRYSHLCLLALNVCISANKTSGSLSQRVFSKGMFSKTHLLFRESLAQFSKAFLYLFICLEKAFLTELQQLKRTCGIIRQLIYVAGIRFHFAHYFFKFGDSPLYVSSLISLVYYKKFLNIHVLS